MSLESQPIESLPNEEVLTQIIASTKDFSDLYDKMLQAGEVDSGFCDSVGLERTIKYIQSLEAVGVPEMADTPSSPVFQTITRKYGLRAKVTDLIKALPPRGGVQEHAEDGSVDEDARELSSVA